MELIQRFQEIDARRHFNATKHNEYTMQDTNVWGILDPAYQELQIKSWTIMREEEERVGTEVASEEQSPRDYERMVLRLKALLNKYVESNKALTPFVLLNNK